VGYLKDKINELETNSKNSNTKETCTETQMNYEGLPN
jgi:hypothetical protein